MKKYIHGFTLIEILIALVIFAIVGVLAASSLHMMIREHARIQKADAQITQAEVAMTLLRRDFSEVIDRPITNNNGVQELGFFSAGNNEIDFTRTGIVNPLQLAQQSNMQRVGYVISGGQLIRLQWPSLDQAPNMQAAQKILLRGVISAEWQFVDDHGKLWNTWPPKNVNAENITALPKAVSMVLHVEKIGLLQGVFPIPARGGMPHAQLPTT